MLRANLDGSELEVLVTMVADVDVAIGIWVDVSKRHVYYTSTDVVGRVDLDGRNHTVLVENAGVLTGIRGTRRH